MPEDKTDKRFFPGRPASEIVGRGREMIFAKEIGELLLKNEPAAVLVSGLPGIGKSEFLKQAANQCHDIRKGIASVYLPPARSDLKDFEIMLAKDMISAVRGQKTGKRIAAEDGLERSWIESEKGTSGALLRRLAESPGSCDERTRMFILARLAVALAEETDCRLVVYMDDIQKLPDPYSFLRSVVSDEISGRGYVSWVMVLPREMIPRAAGLESSLMKSLNLDALEEKDSEELLAIAMRRAGVSFDRQCREAAGLLGGVPVLIWQAAASARLSGISGFEDVDAFLKFYAREQSAGFLHEYHQALLSRRADKELLKGSLELMLHLMSRKGPPAGKETLAREMLKDADQLKNVLENLADTGLLEERWGRIIVTAPVSLADFCRDQSRRHLEGCSEAESGSRLFLEKKKLLKKKSEEKARKRNIEELKAFMVSWKDIALPRSLFDFERFRGLFEKDEQPDIAELSAKDKSRLVLPKVIDAWQENFRGSDQVPAYDIDLLALSITGKDGSERWLAVDVKLGEIEVTSKMVNDFDRRLRLFQNRQGLKPASLTGWILSGGTFSAEAMNAVRELRFWSSAPPQVKLMAAVSGYDKTVQFALPEAKKPHEESYKFQLVIPARSETELVAAKALEQLGENLLIGEVEIGKVKMALVEACLNAFEHSLSEDKKVYLTFSVMTDRLEIEVFNRGRSFIPERIVKPAVEDKVGASYKRGWGLSIINELMDEMEFFHKEEGTLLKMVKYFSKRSQEDKNA